MSTLVHNAKIFTAEAGVDELHSAMAISSTGRVLLVGTEEQARAALNSADSSTITETDLNGRVVLPGILDAHSHISMLGGSLLKPDLIHCKSLAEIRQTLLDFHAQDPARPRLLGRAWMFDTLVDEEGKLQRPHKRFLDEWFPETPVYLDSMDLHSVWVNSAALKELGVSAHLSATPKLALTSALSPLFR